MLTPEQKQALNDRYPITTALVDEFCTDAGIDGILFDTDWTLVVSCERVIADAFEGVLKRKGEMAVKDKFSENGKFDIVVFILIEGDKPVAASPTLATA